MPDRFASALLLVAIVATILPPGYFAYVGAYVALGVCVIALIRYGWRDRRAFSHPVSLNVLGSLVLVSATLPFTYRSGQDLLALVLLLPLFSTMALAALAHRASWVPSPSTFAAICLLASFLAFGGGAYEHFLLDIDRSGLGNNPIHFGSLAAMAGCLALVGIAASTSHRRFVFLLGPLFALGAATISDSRGPMAGTLAMAGLGLFILAIWLWREVAFRLALVTVGVVAGSVIAFLVSADTTRVAGLAESAFNIFRFTGGADDIRAALYASAIQMLGNSPIYGVGMGQVMPMAEAMFPDLVPRYRLENLHADWANLAAMAGSLGLAAYLLLLSAPLLLLAASRARRDRPVVLGAILLVAGQLTLGISNTMFGVLPQTMVYAIVLGYFVIRVRRLDAEAA